MQTWLPGLQCLNDAGEGTFDAAAGGGSLPISAPGGFHLMLSVDDVALEALWLQVRQLPFSPQAIVVTGVDARTFELDVTDEALIKVLEILLRPR